VIFHPAGRFEVPDILHAAGGKIVEQDDIITAIEQPLRKVGANEASAACD
jgi:seryl-tRNA(Sec) selenium transferase